MSVAALRGTLHGSPVFTQTLHRNFPLRDCGVDVRRETFPGCVARPNGLCNIRGGEITLQRMIQGSSASSQPGDET
jgi:hypothetical protein